MSSRDGVPMLSLDELRKIADDLRDDLQRKANQGIRKKDWEQGIGSLAAMESVSEFIRLCELRAQMYAEVERRFERRKVGSKVTSIPAPAPIVRKREKPDADSDTVPSWRERVKG